jgi:NDP-4-keto-2,6-dideoxyhexose 3-C-methyltransferase
MSYTPLMVQQMAFDNICHEHVYYHSLSSIQALFQQHNMMVIDANVNDTNGGSIRIYLAKQNCSPRAFGTAQLRQVCAYRADAIFNFERIADISDPKVWATFATRLEQLKISMLDFVKTARAEGKTIYGYGASTKGNTLLQYFGLTKEDITAIAERSPYKFGKKTVGTEIPIVSEAEMRAARPDYLLVLPWHFIDEFVQREQEYLQAGGALVVPCPEFKIITKDNS